MTYTRPHLIFADAQGRILDHPHLEMAGSSAGQWRRLQPGEWIPMPKGSEIFLLPRRLPVGFDGRKNRFVILRSSPWSAHEPVQAVAAFVAPAHTQIYSAAYHTVADAPLLPLFAYTAVGWMDGQFVVSAFRVDPDPRQDFTRFNRKRIEENVKKRIQHHGGNRLLNHLAHCALGYGCPAARNLFLNRWEAPLPTSPVCNARCLGCISLQEDPRLEASQERIRFVPNPEEIVNVALPHLEEAPKAIVSFGQGCEGEPLLQWKTLLQAVKRLRRQTKRGTINCNTNASRPETLEKLAEAGLDSIRVSLNSANPTYYSAYYRPKGYDFRHVLRSMRVMKDAGKFVSLNYFILPGFNDDPAEFDSLSRLIETAKPDLIQMRNFNIDPQWLLRSLRFQPTGRPLGIVNLMIRLRQRFPWLRFGYYNPCLQEGES